MSISVIEQLKKKNEEKEQRDPILWAVMRPLRKHRIEQGISQKEVAEMCNLQESTVVRMENAQHSPRFSTFVRYFKAINMDIVEIINDFFKQKWVISFCKDGICRIEIVETKYPIDAILKVVDDRSLQDFASLIEKEEHEVTVEDVINQYKTWDVYIAEPQEA